MKFPHLFVLLAFSLFILSCEKPIEFVPESQPSKLVVEGIIEGGQHPVVVVSNSLNYFSTISREELLGSFVRNAEISISNGTETEILKEYQAQVSDDTLIYYYSVDTVNGRVGMKGEEGRTYNVNIRVNDQDYTAVTTIPHLTKTLDSLYYYPVTLPEEPNKVILYGRFNDPPGLGNYIRYFTSVNGGLYLPGLNSVFDDQVVDGKQYNVQIEQGVNRNTEIDFETYSYFDKGDIISIKFCNIDKAVFDFWRTMEYSYSSIGNPFSSPTKVIGNISNGALGYFGGYAVQYVSIIIPE